jgi:hypothetical protein
MSYDGGEGGGCTNDERLVQTTRYYTEAPHISSTITAIFGFVRKIAKRMEQLGCNGTDFYKI